MHNRFVSVWTEKIRKYFRKKLFRKEISAGKYLCLPSFQSPVCISSMFRLSFGFHILLSFFNNTMAAHERKSLNDELSIISQVSCKAIMGEGEREPGSSSLTFPSGLVGWQRPSTLNSFHLFSKHYAMRQGNKRTKELYVLKVPCQLLPLTPSPRLFLAAISILLQSWRRVLTQRTLKDNCFNEGEQHKTSVLKLANMCYVV